MSAYMCRSDTIAYIVWCTQRMLDRLEFCPDDTLREYCDYNDRMDRPSKFYEDLWGMNVKALYERYEDAEDMFSEFEPYDFSMIARYELNYVKLVNYLDCFLYQCAEGMMYKSNLYKACERIQSAAAKIYIRELPEYSEHPWGTWGD